jgi:hypothetical protein
MYSCCREIIALEREQAQPVHRLGFTILVSCAAVQAHGVGIASLRFRELIEPAEQIGFRQRQCCTR